MNKYFLTLLCAFALTDSFSQTNTLPTTGKVGIGTTSPLYPLTVVSTSNAFSVSNGTKGVLLQGQPIGGGIIGFYNGIYNNLDIRASSITGSQLYLTTSGNIGIGTTTPDSKLAVNGIMHCKEVKVDLTGWPDYVFKSGYNLPSLSDIKTYIEQNHHLPDMPSESQVAKDGLNLGEMNAKLLKKIEELTLFLIEKDEKEKKLEQRLEKLENPLNP